MSLPFINGTIPDASDFNALSIKSEMASTIGAGLVGTIGNGAGVVSRTVKSKLNDVVSVKDFGAVGDGITDDYPAFQAAINSVSMGTAITIGVPAGTYKLLTTPTANSRIPTFIFYGGASIVGTFILPFQRFANNSINFDNGSIRVGSNNAFTGGGALVIGGADFIENGNGSYLVNDGHPNWNVIQSSITHNPTEFNIYPNACGGIAVGDGATTTIVRTTGFAWTSAMVGKRFFFEGTLYTVSSFTDASHLVLSAIPPAVTGTWHFVYTTGSGTCSVVGTTVTRLSGEPFNPFISVTAFLFQLNGVPVTVSVWVSGDQLTLSSPPGDISNTPYTFELSINDQLSTLRIQKLDGSNEENLSIYAKPQGYYLAALGSGSAQQRSVYLCSGTTSSSPQPVAELHSTGKFISLGGTATDDSLRALWTSGQVNRFDVFGSTAGVSPSLRSRGTDTNIGFGLDTKGTGNYTFTSHSFGNIEFQIFGSGGTSYLAVGSSSGASPILSANGAAADISVQISPKGAGSVNISGPIVTTKTITAAGTTGAQTINKTSGTVNFAAAATSLVVTNSQVTVNSIIICTVGTNDTTMKSALAVAAAGSFTIFSNAAATAETRVNFLVIN